MYPKIYICILVYGIHVYMYVLYNCICTYRYIYTYMREIIVVRRWTIHRACHSKWKIDLFKKSKKLKAAFFRSKVASPARSNSVEQMRLLVRLLLFLCYSHFCTTAWQKHRRSIKDMYMGQERYPPIPTPPHPTMISVARHIHRRSIKDVYMCQERYHPIPTPPHHDLRSTTQTQT